MWKTFWNTVFQKSLKHNYELENIRNLFWNDAQWMTSQNVFSVNVILKIVEAITSDLF